MNVLLVWAHPLEDSYSARLARSAESALQAAGNTVDFLDLYREDFDPVMSTDERRCYEDLTLCGKNVGDYVDRLKSADGLVFVFPTWNFGLPAIMKGFLDRVFLPGVAFHLSGGVIKPGLQNVRRFASITTYGGPQLVARAIIGDPARKVVMRGLVPLFGPGCRSRWYACYGMNQPQAAKLDAFESKINQKLAAWA